MHELQYKLNTDVIVVLHDSDFDSYLRSSVTGYGNGIFENLPHVIASLYYYNRLSKDLLEIIKNPKQNRFDLIRNTDSSTNISCLKNTNIGVIYKVVDKMPYYENWFVELMIRLENVLVDKNKEGNVKFHFFIIGTIYFNLPKMAHHNYEITKIKTLSSLYSWYLTDKGKNKVFLTTFLEEYDMIFEALNSFSMLGKYKNVGLIARKDYDDDFKKIYKSKLPSLQNNIIDVSIDDCSSDETLDLLLEALVEEGC